MRLKKVKCERKNLKVAVQADVYLSRQRVGSPERHSQLSAVATDELHVVQKAVLGAEHHRWTTKR